ncbi:hypothetical protein HDU76_006893, partial [Blyttiomyces sp. JEL0837]
SVSGAVSLWNRQLKSAAVAGGSSVAATSRSGKKARMQDLAVSVTHAVEVVSGVPLHVSFHGGHASGAAGSAVFGDEDVGPSSVYAKELESVRAMHSEALYTIEEQRREIELLRAFGAKPEDATAPGQGGQAVREEIRRLQEAVESLTRERDDALTSAASPKDEAEVSKSETVAHQLGPLPEINVPKPYVTLRPLQWTKTPAKAYHTSIWKEIIDSAYIADQSTAKAVLDQVEIDQLQELFKKADDLPTSPRVAFQKKITLLDMTRARNIEILLGSLRVSYQTIREAIITVNDEVLTADRLAILMQCIPTDEEIELVQSFPGEPSQLGMAERFILTLSTVPRLRQRLQAIHYRQRFNEEIEEVTPDLSTVEDAIKAVRSSEKLKKVLQAVLVIGNFMNGGSFRGGAYGFQIESLLKLRETKAVDQADLRDRAPTLLHYLARRLEEVDEENMNLKEELGPVELASRVSISGLFQSVKHLNKGIDIIKTELTEVDAVPENDWFRDVMNSFVLSSEVRIGELMKRSEKIEKEVNDMLEYFGEDLEKREAPPEDFFRTLWEFQAALQRAWKENIAADEKAAKNGRPNAFTRRALPTPMQLAVQKRLANLKPVQGMDPFSKRLTIRRGMMPRLGALVPESGEMEEIGRIMRAGTSFKPVIAARKTVRRMQSRASGVGGKKGEKSLNVGYPDGEAEVEIPVVNEETGERTDVPKGSVEGESNIGVLQELLDEAGVQLDDPLV